MATRPRSAHFRNIQIQPGKPLKWAKVGKGDPGPGLQDHAKAIVGAGTNAGPIDPKMLAELLDSGKAGPLIGEQVNALSQAEAKAFEEYIAGGEFVSDLVHGLSMKSPAADPRPGGGLPEGPETAATRATAYNLARRFRAALAPHSTAPATSTPTPSTLSQIDLDERFETSHDWGTSPLSPEAVGKLVTIHRAVIVHPPSEARPKEARGELSPVKTDRVRPQLKKTGPADRIKPKVKRIATTPTLKTVAGPDSPETPRGEDPSAIGPAEKKLKRYAGAIVNNVLNGQPLKQKHLQRLVNSGQAKTYIENALPSWDMKMVFYQRVGRETFFEIEEDPTAPSGSIERLVDWFRKALVVPDDLPPLPPQELEESGEDIPTEPVKTIHTPVVAGPTSGPTATQIEMGLDLAKRFCALEQGEARLEIARTLEKLARQVSPQSVGVFGEKVGIAHLALDDQQLCELTVGDGLDVFFQGTESETELRLNGRVGFLPSDET
ncbi:MAG: hypothetical protein ABWZ57_02700, partial [Mesorhizobium sp.]